MVYFSIHIDRIVHNPSSNTANIVAWSKTGSYQSIKIYRKWKAKNEIDFQGDYKNMLILSPSK